MTQAEIDRQTRFENAELLRALVASVDHVRTSQETQSSQLADIRERVIGIESQGHAASIAAINLRLNVLEGASQRRDGATGLIDTVFKSPALAWIFGAATLVWGIVTGRIDL